MFVHRIDVASPNCWPTWLEVTIRLELERESYLVINFCITGYYGNWQTRL